MEEKIKNILSVYIKIPAEQINAGTLIDRSAVASSILLHRMYAHLANEGIVIENYWDTKTFEALMQKLAGGVKISAPLQREESNFYHADITIAHQPSVGIDIEDIQLMPPASDFREDEFYTMNFAPSEIAHCILQSNPYASFAGLFAAKEAIVKADNQFSNTPFNAIIIQHLPSGKPFHPQFQISISHTAYLAVAVAIQLPAFSDFSAAKSSASQKANSPISRSLVYFLCFLAISLSTITLLIILTKK